MADNRHLKGAAALLLLGILAIGGWYILRPILADNQQVQTSDAAANKGRIVIGMDNFVGYFPLCSPKMQTRMRADGYDLVCQDDKADYATRYANLQSGTINLAVGTVDSYVLHGRASGYQAVIAAVLDESHGADAIIARRDAITNLDGLKSYPDLKVAFTPDSPSHHLLKAVGVHFDVPQLRVRDGSWQLTTTGSSDALKKLVSGEAQVAVLWEPDVSKALAQPGAIKLVGTDQTDKLIVDVLLVGREYLKRHPDVVKLVLANYWQTLKHYRDHPDELKRDVAKYTSVTPDQTDTMLRSVQWYSLHENATAWFGLGAVGTATSYGLIETIDGAVSILSEYGDVTGNPLPSGDPRRITNSSIVSELYATGMLPSDGSNTVLANSLERTFSPLNDAGWARLQEVGTLKVRPIIFQSGTSTLTIEGKEQLDQMVTTLKSYPHFRVLVEGHTKPGGDEEANRTLSAERAEAVTRYLGITYNLDPNRVRAMGIGSSRPLPRGQSESFRAHQDRLARVEVHLMTETY